MPKSPPTVRLELEPLEERQLLAARVSLTAAGILQIEGTAKAETVVISQQDKQLSVQNFSMGDRSPTTTRYNLSQVREIVFRGSEGNDLFRNETAVRSTAQGDGGNDSLTGGSGDDVLLAGRGDDK